MAAWLTGAGLLLDIAGFLLLFRVGLPPELRRSGLSYIALEQEDEAEKAKARRYDRWARVALAAVVVGFALQFAGTVVGAASADGSPSRDSGGWRTVVSASSA